MMLRYLITFLDIFLLILILIGMKKIVKEKDTSSLLGSLFISFVISLSAVLMWV